LFTLREVMLQQYVLARDAELMVIGATGGPVTRSIRPNAPYWRKSSVSGADTNCVEVAFADEGETVLVRHSKQPDAAVLAFTRAEWKAFLTGVRQGEFDGE